MKTKKFVLTFIIIIIFSLFIKISIGETYDCSDSECGCSADVGVTSGAGYIRLYVKSPSGIYSQIAGSDDDDASGNDPDPWTTDYTINIGNEYCDEEGQWQIYFQYHQGASRSDSPTDGSCEIDSYYVDRSMEDFCKDPCFSGMVVDWDGTLGCCGNEDIGDCALSSGTDVCIKDADNDEWSWIARSGIKGDIIDLSCGSNMVIFSDGTSIHKCHSSSHFDEILSITEGTTHQYICYDTGGGTYDVAECVGNSGTTFNDEGDGVQATLGTQARGYYCLMTSPTSSNTYWSSTAPTCTNFCDSTVDPNICCMQDGTEETIIGSYTSGDGLTCYYNAECTCSGWEGTQNAPKPDCADAGDFDLPSETCYFENWDSICTDTGWTTCTGTPAEVGFADCNADGDYITDTCYYGAQSNFCTVDVGWTCTDGTSEPKDTIPSIIGGGLTCRYGIDTLQGNEGCLAGSGWQYLDHSEKAYCAENGEISADGNCFYEDRSDDSCETNIGWNCVNGSFETPAEKPTDCTYHTGTCSESGGKWNPDCTLHYDATGEKCISDSGWGCFGGKNPIPAETDSGGLTCTDCNMDGTCDNTQLSGNDNDGDGVLNVCEPDETPELIPAPEDPDYSDPDDECADGFDNDDDGDCDYYGCFCDASNNYCGKGIAWDGENMPADEDCSATCSPCNECGFGIFNKCDIDECNSCLPSGSCTFQPSGIDYCCLDEDHDTYCEDTQSPQDLCPGQDDRTDVDLDASSADDDIYRDCLDEYLECDLDDICVSYGWGDEDCKCPDCNLSSFPCQAYSGTVCIQEGPVEDWECMDWDENAYNCEMHALETTEGNCDLDGEVSCWDNPYMGTVINAKCCGDDAGSDLWQNDDTSGCSMGTFYLDPDLDTTGILCNYDESTGLGIDCQAGITQPSCWYYEPDPACCGDDPLEYQTYSDGNVACCPRDNDYAEGGGNCIPQSTYIHPLETDASLTNALGSEAGNLDEILYPYNQSVTLIKPGGDPLFEIEGQFSVLDRQTDGTISIPPINNGDVDLSGLKITDEGTSIYFNMTWLKESRPRNRISDEYTTYIRNINDGIGMTICTDPQSGQGKYGDECSVQTAFTKASTLNNFKLEITESYYKITTNLEQNYDWYVFIHVQPKLKLESDADLMTKRSFENVGFHAELKAPGGSVIPDAACKIFYHEDPETGYIMEYNDTSEKYYYERTYTGKGTYDYEVKCSHPFYLSVSSSKSAKINPNSELIIYDITDSKTRLIEETVDFYAFYRSLPDQNMIKTPTTSCNITYHDESDEQMTLDIDENNEEYFSEDRSYLNYGTFSYVVKCAETGYDTMTSVDVVEIFPTTCAVTQSDNESLVAGKTNFNIISKRGFVLLKKAQ